MFRTVILAFALVLCTASPAVTQDREAAIKSQILDLAEKAAAKGPDAMALRGKIDGLTKELIALSPQKPVKERLGELHGTWRTVLPPDEKPDKVRSNMLIDQSKVWQVVSPKGYVYNIMPVKNVKDPAKSRLGLLRGTYKVAASNPNGLTLRYTRFTGCKACLSDPNPVKFAAQAEAGTLPDKSSIVPDLFVGTAVGNGTMLEVYSDGNLRIGYGTPNKQTGRRAIYVLKKA